MIGNKNGSAAQLLEKQTLLQKDVVERLRRRDVAQIDVNRSRLGKRLPVEDNIETELFSETANEGLEISTIADYAKLFRAR